MGVKRSQSDGGRIWLTPRAALNCIEEIGHRRSEARLLHCGLGNGRFMAVSNACPRKSSRAHLAHFLSRDDFFAIEDL